jgi:hypothetical protein
MLAGKPSIPKANLTSDMDQVQTASVKPVAIQPVSAPANNEAVKDYLKTGKKLPSYISDSPTVEDASTAPAVKPAPVVRKPGTITINPDGTIAKDEPATEVASVPTVQPSIVAPKPYPASMRPKPPADKPLILDEDSVASRDPLVRPVEPQPVIGDDELEEWDSGSLAEYLERKGLLSDGETANSSATYDEDGFFLSDGPNRNNRSRVRRYEDSDLLF